MADQTVIDGVDILCSGSVKIGPEEIHIHRDIGFTRDIDGSWSFLVMLPEDRDAKGGYRVEDASGGMRVTDPEVIAFIEHLARMVANPAHYDGNDGYVTIGPEDGPIKRERAA